MVLDLAGLLMERLLDLQSKSGDLNPAALYFRDLFRNARSMALKDAENFDQVLFVVESLGKYLLQKQGNLGKYKECIKCQDICKERQEYEKELDLALLSNNKIQAHEIIRKWTIYEI